MEPMVDHAQPTICIAERNANIRDLLRREFGREGYAVVTAGSGGEVLEQLAGLAAVDLVVLDVEIADPDGGSLTARIERLYPLLPVVLHVFPGLDDGEGGWARVEKGGDFERLKDTVRQVLREGAPIVKDGGQP